jgi:DNA processing protein
MIMTDLVQQAKVDEFEARAIQPVRELGAYEALWAREGVSFKTIAEQFGKCPGAVPSDFVSEHEAKHFARLALGTIREAGIRHFGIRVNGAAEYPAKLRDAAHPVELLYFQGSWALTNTPCVAVVGTRQPTDEGLRRAAKLTRGFVKAGYTIVSGLAQGIDTIAHRTALESRGRTIAVLGTPITTTYPAENRELQLRIADEQLVISQVPIVRYSRQKVAVANRFYFPERNVTMSALTVATVIVEAGNTSGTLVQARHALQQERQLFILESCFTNPELTWPQKFLERGAVRVSTFEEILERLPPKEADADRRADAPGA